MISERAINLVDTNAPQDLMLFETTRRQGRCLFSSPSACAVPLLPEQHYLYIRSKVDVHTCEFVFLLEIDEAQA